MTTFQASILYSIEEALAWTLSHECLSWALIDKAESDIRQQSPNETQDLLGVDAEIEVWENVSFLVTCTFYEG